MILLQRLEILIIRGNFLKLFRTYLLNIQQIVWVADETSSYRKIEYAVPQGTVLSPILNIYISGVFNIESFGDVIAFVDDSGIFYYDNNWNTLKRQVERDFIEIQNNFSSKLLSINLDTTKYLPLSNTTCFTTFHNLDIGVQGKSYVIPTKNELNIWVCT